MSFCRKTFIAALLCAGVTAAAADMYPVQSYNPNTGESSPVVISTTTTMPAPVQTPPAQTSPEQASLARTRAFEAQPLNFPDEAAPRRAPGAVNSRREVTMPSVWPALFSVLAVCGLFCAALYLMKKYVPGHRQLFNHPAVEVLGRTHIDQKRSVTLVRVGKRVLVVGVSPDEMRALSEITDEAEITEIMEVARPKTEAGLSLFQKLFKRNVLDGEAEEARAMADVKAEQLREQLQALRNKVADIAPAHDRNRGRRVEHAEHFDAVG